MKQKLLLCIYNKNGCIFTYLYTRTFKDSEDYRTLLSQYQLVVQQLDASRQEIRTIREQSDKSQREIYMIKSQTESGSTSIKYELENSKKEVLRLTQFIQSLKIELENVKKENSQVLNIYSTLSNYIINTDTNNNK